MTGRESSPRAAPSPGWLAVAAAVAWSTWLRLGIVAAGPDPDVDGYGHFLIARKLAAEWRDLKVHWVWLPLWHGVDRVIYALGGGITAVRHFSVACSAASAFLLAWLLRRHLADDPSPTPWVAAAERSIPFAAGALLALWPQNLSVGASAEPEAFFQLVVLAAVAAWERRRYALAGVALSLAAMLRYETWPVLPAFLALWWRGPRTPRAALAWLLPGAAVVAWCALHRANTGAWLWFLKENRQYVTEAWRDFRLVERAPLKLRWAPVWYALIVPAYSLGPWIAALAAGAPWLARRGPRALAASALALLAVVTGVWVARTNLGLERHFAALIPAYAAMVTAGVALPIAWAATRVTPRAPLAVAAALALTGWSFARSHSAPAARHHRERGAATFVAERRLAALLRERAAPGSTLFVDDARVEVLSGLPPERFVRWRPIDVRDFNMLVECAHHGEAWLLAQPGRLHPIRDTEELYRDGEWVLVRRRARPPVPGHLLAHRPARR